MLARCRVASMEQNDHFMERFFKVWWTKIICNIREKRVVGTKGNDSVSILSRSPCFLASNCFGCLDKENTRATSQGLLLLGFSSAGLQRRCNGIGSITLCRFLQGSLKGMATKMANNLISLCNKDLLRRLLRELGA